MENVTKKRTYNVLEAALAQKNYCKRIGFAHPFAPESGNCYRCGQNIYDENGYSVELASRHLITGCPHCNTSFVD